jgi:hypothetical protein
MFACVCILVAGMLKVGCPLLYALCIMAPCITCAFVCVVHYGEQHLAMYPVRVGGLVGLIVSAPAVSRQPAAAHCCCMCSITRDNTLCCSCLPGTDSTPSGQGQ